MRVLLLGLLLLVAGACASAPRPDVPGVRVEIALVDGEVQPPVFRWDAPVAARVIVRRGSSVVWEIAEGDAPGPDGRARRGTLTPPLVYGRRVAVAGGPEPRDIIAAAPLLPRTVYSVTIIGYDGAKFEGRFSVQERVEVR